MIYHTSVDTTNISKIADYIFSLIDKVDEIGEENIVQVVTDNETCFKAAGHCCWRRENICFGLPVQHIALI